ncbi:MAG: imidazole glycerol phosphate synthase subunit HisH [Candidatus Nealsonbacteria bacterium]|nr:imidazole glycerol phosphate synthase subunit HisH [Candidatus Nealsonbacteria bacterium]
MTIAIINYKMGNLRSVLNAFESLGADAKIVDSPDLLSSAKAVVLPGVGAFKEGVDNLKNLNFVKAIEVEVLEKKKPFLGICLGAQMIAKKGFEHGEHEGLGWLDFDVRKIAPKDNSFRIPHMGWNNLEIKNGGGRLFNGIKDPAVVYFVHSYHLVPVRGQEKYITSTAWHGESITASIEKDNIFGVQFHPEKSQNTGLALLKNFIDLAYGKT